MTAAQNMCDEKKIRLMKTRRTGSVGSDLSETAVNLCSSSDTMTLLFYQGFRFSKQDSFRIFPSDVVLIT